MRCSIDQLFSLSKDLNMEIFSDFLIKRLHGKPHYIAGSEVPFIVKIPVNENFNVVVNLLSEKKSTMMYLSPVKDTDMTEHIEVTADTPQDFLLRYNQLKDRVFRLAKFSIDGHFNLWVSEAGIKLMRLNLRRDTKCVVSCLTHMLYITTELVTGVNQMKTEKPYLGELLIRGEPEYLNLYYSMIRRLKKNRVESSETFQPTVAMQKAGEKALAWRRQYKRGMTPVGIARAKQLKNRQALSLKTVKRMKAYFDRHAVDKNSKAWATAVETGVPSNGMIAWEGWGGDAGRAWAEKILSKQPA